MKSLILFCWIGLLGWCFGIPGKHIGPVKIITLCKLCESQYSLIGNPKHLKNEIKNLKEQLSILKRENEMFKQIQHVYKDCSEALKINSNITKDYLIQPNLKAGVIKVACENRNGKVFAVVEHDSQSQNFVHGYEKPGSYKKAIKYKVDVKKIKALINYSKECRQFTKAVCKGSFLSNLNKWPKPTWLEGYKHKKLNFWGGGPSNGRGCACGIKKKCVQPKLKCNCDINTHDKWRTDEGYITDKSVLPITVVRVGDTGDAKEQLIFQIGKLECVM